MSDPNSPDDALPPEYTAPDVTPDPPPVIDTNDVAYQAEQALAPGGIAEQTTAAQAKLAADEKSLEGDTKVKIALAIDKIRALLDEVAPVVGLLPDPARTGVTDVIKAVDLADDLLAKIGL